MCKLHVLTYTITLTCWHLRPDYMLSFFLPVQTLVKFSSNHWTVWSHLSPSVEISIIPRLKCHLALNVKETARSDAPTSNSKTVSTPTAHISTCCPPSPHTPKSVDLITHTPPCISSDSLPHSLYLLPAVPTHTSSVWYLKLPDVLSETNIFDPPTEQLNFCVCTNRFRIVVLLNESKCYWAELKSTRRLRCD